MSCSYPVDSRFGVMYEEYDEFMRDLADHILAVEQRLYKCDVEASFKPDTPQPKQHGPQRKGRGGKIKRW